MNIIEQPFDLANIVDSEVLTNIFSPAVFAVSVVELLLTSLCCVCR